MKRLPLLLLCLIFLTPIISCRKPDTEPISLSGDSILKGTIYSPNGQVAMPAVIIETMVDGVKKSTSSNQEGKFSLELPAGEHDVKFYTGSGAHFSNQKRVKIEAGKTTEMSAADTRLLFTGKIAFVRGEYDAIQVLIQELGVPVTELSVSDMTDYDILKQYDLLLLNCNSGYIDFETDKMLERYLKDGHSIYASDLELRVLSKKDWGFIPSNLLSYVLDGEEGITEANVTYDPFKKALGKDKMTIDFDLPMYVQIKQLATTDSRFTVLVDHPQKGPLALNIQWGPTRTSTQGIRYGGNIIYTTFHDARLSGDVKAVLQQMILQL